MIERIAVVGPTAVGKTDFAVQLAEYFEGELINADSRQVLSDVSVATGKPTPAELRGIRCHCLNLANVGDEFSVHDWLKAARRADTDILSRGRVPILVGGTGLYVSSFVEGFREDPHAVDTGRRAERNALVEQGRLAELVSELAARDADAVALIDVRNPRRVIRALELLDAGWETVEQSRRRSDARPALVLGVDIEGREYETRVTSRVSAMFGEALRDEVSTLIEAGRSDDEIGRAGIGYPEAVHWVRGLLGRDAAIAATVTRTLQYATSQRTWWRSHGEVIWVDPKHTFAGIRQN